MDEPGRKGCRHTVRDTPVGLPVSAGDHCGALRQPVFADCAVKHQLIERCLHHWYSGGQFLEVDQKLLVAVFRWQERRWRPAGSAIGVPPGNATQIDGIKEEGANVDIFAIGRGGDLLNYFALGAARRSPDDHRLLRLDHQGKGCGEIGRGKRVVSGYRNGLGHRQSPDGGSTASTPSGLTNRHPKPAGRPRCGVRSSIAVIAAIAASQH